MVCVPVSHLITLVISLFKHRLQFRYVDLDIEEPI